jgi:hypothetical protein
MRNPNREGFLDNIGWQELEHRYRLSFSFFPSLSFVFAFSLLAQRHICDEE